MTIAVWVIAVCEIIRIMQNLVKLEMSRRNANSLGKAHMELNQMYAEITRNAPERKTAHWVFGNTMGHSWMKCSECCVSQSGQTGCWTYCPNCGAEMKGETEVEID